jgi:hypothetical protein
VVDAVNKTGSRKLGRVQASVLKVLLERGTYPGTWHWQNSSTTTKTLESLLKRGLVTTELVDKTDWQGNPDPHGAKVTFYRPVQWMRNAMDAPEEQALALLSVR